MRLILGLLSQASSICLLSKSLSSHFFCYCFVRVCCVVFRKLDQAVHLNVHAPTPSLVGQPNVGLRYRPSFQATIMLEFHSSNGSSTMQRVKAFGDKMWVLYLNF